MVEDTRTPEEIEAEEAAAKEAAEKEAAEAAEKAAAKKSAPKAKKDFDLVDKFLELSDYEKKDVHGFSKERRTVVTTNGGKYEISPKGTRVRVLQGPDTPAMIAEASEEDEEE
jgi:hypothetical protein